MENEPAVTENETQKNYWSEGAGKLWVSNHDAMTLLMQKVSDALVDRVDPAHGDRILDIGCGAGETSFAFARRVGANGSVLGTDISETLLRHARNTALGNKAKSVAFEYGDAQTHQFNTAAYDHLVSRFGVMFFADPGKALANLRKALRPGGALCFACWAPASENPWFTIPAKIAIERLGRPAPTLPNAPGPFGFSDETYVLALLNGAGFSNCKADLVGIDLCPAGDADDVARLACELGPAVRIIEEFNGDEADCTAIATAISSSIKQYQTPEGFRIPAKIWFYTALNN